MFRSVMYHIMPAFALLTLYASISCSPKAKPQENQPSSNSVRSTEASWETYRNEKAGYLVEYPTDWTVEESGTEDMLVTSFAPAGGGAGIMVSVQSGEMHVQLDIPNTRCQAIMIGGLSGTRCFDTMSFSTSTTLVARGKTYTIAVTGKRQDTSVYENFLDTFQLLP